MRWVGALTSGRPAGARAATLAIALGLCAAVAATATVVGRPGASDPGRAIAAAPREDKPIADPVGQPGVTTELPDPPGTTERVSVADDEAQLNGASGGASANLPAAKPNQAISADGRWVAFTSEATDVIPGQALPAGGIYVRDRESGATVAIPWVDGNPFRVGVTASEPTISSDGGVIAFTVVVTTRLSGIAGGSSSAPYVLAWDRLANTTEVVSLDSNSRPTPGWQPSISGDGRYIAYTQWAASNPPTPSNPTANPTNLAYAPCGPTSSTIAVTVTDPEDDVSNVTLFYSPSGGGTFSMGMSSAGSNTWQATIAIGTGWNTGQITYWVRATDSQGNTSSDVFPSISNILTLHTCIL